MQWWRDFQKLYSMLSGPGAVLGIESERAGISSMEKGPELKPVGAGM